VLCEAPRHFAHRELLELHGCTAGTGTSLRSRGRRWPCQVPTGTEEWASHDRSHYDLRLLCRWDIDTRVADVHGVAVLQYNRCSSVAAVQV